MKKENYDRYMIIGLVLTLLVLGGLIFYWLGENTRLAKASETFADERVNRGREIYMNQCVSCHGAQGEGGVGFALNDRNLLKNTLDAVFFSIIRSGVPNTQMPAWSVDYGGPLTDEDVRDVVAFIRAWEPTAPEIQPVVFEPDAGRGALLFASTCSLCHGENGMGSDKAPALNDPARLAALQDDWYRDVIKNGRPAKGMPTWGTVLSPEQIEDILALIDAWREGTVVEPEFSVTDLLTSAIFSLQNDDSASAAIQVDRALTVAQGPGAEVLRNAAVQLSNGDSTGALATLEALSAQWPIGDSAAGGEIYSTYCLPCHGAQGEGGIGKQLNPNEFVASNTTPDLVQFILDGREGTAMAGFDGRLDEAQIADVIAFLRLWQE
ncbi:MAG: c-type cytochrome [Ardenticatenaceae bacterium]|nr:c-type cytochrome [Ardenticatenaceae bacterium]